MAEMIELNNVSFQYETDSGDQALKHITLGIKKGECVVLTGESGCGKTTLTRCVNGLVPDFYEGSLSGELFLEGHSLLALPQYHKSSRIGTVFQDPRSQFFTVNSTDEAAFGCENLAMSTEEINRRVNQSFRSLQMENLRDRSLFELSSGERQKLAIASVYAMDTAVLVLDEPSANLDQRTIGILRDILLKLKQEGKTLLISEHRLSYLMGVADRYLYIREGEIAESWTPEEAARLTDEERSRFGLRSFRQIRLEDITREVQTGPEERVIEGQGLAVKLGGTEIFRSLDFSFRWGKKGKVVGILGDNGSGKTTFARVLCGLLKPSEGKIRIDGRVTTPKQRIRLTYFVMQDTDYQLFTESVRHELTLAERKNHSGRSLDEIMEKLNLLPFADRHPLSLSGGQKQRVTIAAAFVSGSDILVLDEPTSGLDGKNMQLLKTIIRGLKAEGKLVFVITHDMEFLDGMYDEIMKF